VEVVLRVVAGLCILAGCGRFGFDDEVAPDACAVTLTPAAQRANFHSHVTLAAAGGRAPYEITLDAGPGTVSVDGVFAATDQPGIATITARDVFGCSATTMIDVGGDSLFYVGGASNAVPTREVLRSDDGLTWTVVGILPAARTTGALYVLDDQMYWVSGAGAATATDVYASSDGVTWAKIADVPVGATSFGNTVKDGEMWMVGGNGNTGAVTHSRDGITWTLAGQLPMDNHGGSLSAFGGNLIYAGGHNGNLFDWVLSSPDGATWTRIGTLPMGREYHRAIVVDGTLFLVGGQDTTPTPLPLVTATTDGMSFVSDPMLPAGRPFGSLAIWRGELWSIGGSDMGGVWTASPGGAWQQRASNFAPRQGGGLAVFTPR
jgi:hypothetical protein